MPTEKPSKKSFLNSDFALLIVLLALSIFICWPLFKNNFITTIDGGDHLLRLYSMDQFIGKGQWFVRWVPYLHAYGYPEFNFYPPLVAIVGTILMKIGLGIIWALNLGAFFFIFFSALSMYLLAKEFWGIPGGFLSAAAYILAPYQMVDLYARGDYAESAAFAFLPLILWSFLKLSKQLNAFYLSMAGLSVGGLLLANNCVSLIFCPIIFLYILCLHFPFKRQNYFSFLISLIGFGLGLGLAAFFWLPALIDKQFVHIDRMLQGNLDFHNNFLSLRQLIYSPWPVKPGTGLPYEIGFMHGLIALVSICFIPKIIKNSKSLLLQLFFFLAMLIMAIFLTLPLSLKVWEHIPILRFMQFPSRFLIIITLMVSIFAGGVACIFPKRAWTTVVVGLLAILLVNFSHYHPPYGSNKVNLDNIEPAFVFHNLHTQDGGEFIPKWVQTIRTPTPADNLEIIQGGGEILSHHDFPELHQRFRVKILLPSVLCFNVFYFPGWTVKVDDHPVAILKDNPFGLMVFSVGPGVHDIKADFGLTPLRQAATAVSLVSFLILVGLLLFRLIVFSRRQPKLIKWLEAVFVLFLVYFAIRLLVYHYCVVSFPYPNTYREGAMMATTTLLLHGVPLYSFILEPQYTNIYGILYPVIALPFVKLLGESLVVYRMISAFFIFASCLVVFGVLHKKKVPALLNFWAVLALYASLLYPLTTTSCVDPASTGLFLMLLTVFAPFFLNYSYLSVVISIICGLLAFYTKSYFVLGLPVMASYLFFFVSKRKSVLYTLCSLGGLLLSAVAMNHFFPSYFDDCIFVHNNYAASTSLIIVLQAQLYKFADLNKTLIVLILSAMAYLSWQWLRSSGRSAPKFYLPLEIYAGICFAIVLVCFLGKHLGANLWYFFQLFSPFLVIFVATLCARFSLWVILFSIFLIYNLFSLTFDDNCKYFDRGRTGWHEIEKVVQLNGSILNSALIAPLLIQENREVYDDGQTEYFGDGGKRKGLAARFFSEDKRVDMVQAAFINKVDGMISNKQFSLIIIEAGYASNLIPDDISNYYKSLGSTLVYTPQDRRIYSINVWRPI